MSDLKWWPGWYVTRLHAVRSAVHDHAHLPSLCGAWVYGPEHDVSKRRRAWRDRLLAKAPPHCKRCERKLEAA